MSGRAHNRYIRNLLFDFESGTILIIVHERGHHVSEIGHILMVAVTARATKQSQTFLLTGRLYTLDCTLDTPPQVPP
jgi:hypothetical protein